MWKIPIPHIFLWLLVNNKNLTRDNLAKRRKVEDATACFVMSLNMFHIYFLNVV
jgi:hypothetical protein